MFFFFPRDHRLYLDNLTITSLSILIEQPPDIRRDIQVVPLLLLPFHDKSQSIHWMVPMVRCPAY